MINIQEKVWLIQLALKERGIQLNRELIDEFGIIEYLGCAEDDYTIYDWIKDTRENYPEYFL